MPPPSQQATALILEGHNKSEGFLAQTAASSRVKLLRFGRPIFFKLPHLFLPINILAAAHLFTW